MTLHQEAKEAAEVEFAIFEALCSERSFRTKEPAFSDQMKDLGIDFTDVLYVLGQCHNIRRGQSSGVYVVTGPTIDGLNISIRVIYQGSRNLKLVKIWESSFI